MSNDQHPREPSFFCPQRPELKRTLWQCRAPPPPPTPQLCSSIRENPQPLPSRQGTSTLCRGVQSLPGPFPPPPFARTVPLPGVPFPGHMPAPLTPRTLPRTCQALRAPLRLCTRSPRPGAAFPQIRRLLTGSASPSLPAAPPCPATPWRLPLSPGTVFISSLPVSVSPLAWTPFFLFAPRTCTHGTYSGG